MTLARPIRTVSRIQIPAGYRIRLQLPAVARYHLKTHTCITTEPNSLEVNRPFTRDRNGPITTAVGLKPPAHQCPKGNSGGKDLRVGKSWGCPVWSTGATQSGAASGFNGRNGRRRVEHKRSTGEHLHREARTSGTDCWQTSHQSPWMFWAAGLVFKFTTSAEGSLRVVIDSVFSRQSHHAPPAADFLQQPNRWSLVSPHCRATGSNSCSNQE
jgi:hypothetical protein